jgi:DNA-binding Lrp family transcriptional regulator
MEKFGDPHVLLRSPNMRKKIQTSKSNHHKTLEVLVDVPAAFVLLNTDIGAEAEVVKALKALEGVETAWSLWGVYDIIASVRADTLDKLAYIINKRIEKIAKVHSKLTMIISETGPPLTTLEIATH